MCAVGRVRVALGNTRFMGECGVEVSAVDESVTVRDIPGFTSRKTNMEMNVQTGQTMVI